MLVSSSQVCKLYDKLNFALFDLTIHKLTPALNAEQIQATLDDIRQKVCGFSNSTL